MHKLALISIILTSSVASAQPKNGSGSAAAKQPTTGTVSGTVKVTDDGKEVSNVEVVVYIVGPPDAPGPDKVTATIKQTADKKFDPDLVAITVGERVEFPNTGATLHNVFSTKPKFDLGSFEQGKIKSWQFKDKAVAEIYCNIHPEMAATVVVVGNPYHASADKKTGKFTITNVPAGKWTLFAYTRRSKPVSSPIEVTPGGTTSKSFAIQRAAETKHLNKFGEKYKEGGGGYRN
jgi:plastocyanin